MRVEMRPIASITPYENNPRQNDVGVDAVAASIQAFGFRQPIVVDEAGLIVVGSTRYKAALQLGLEHGFFECTVIGEIIHERKRRLLSKAGNSFQFVIAADELGLAGRS